MLKLLSSALLFILTASLATAHGSVFFEFAPDISSSLDIALVATPTQLFRPPNDFLRGFDLWVANTGAAGSVSFGLRDVNDTLLTSTAVTIPTLAPVYGGTRFHIDFPSQVPLQSNQLYKIRIVSSMPGLKLYRASLIQLLPHTTLNYPEYVVEPAYLGTTEQEFAFKFALYEQPETSAPIISNVAVIIVDALSARIDFNANEPADSRADFGPIGQGLSQSTAFTGSYEFCPEGGAACNIMLPVNPNTTYYYNLIVRDEWGNQSSHTGTFVSQNTPPTPTPGNTPSSSPNVSNPPQISPPASTPTPTPTSPNQSQYPSPPAGTPPPPPPGASIDPSPSREGPASTETPTPQNPPQVIIGGGGNVSGGRTNATIGWQRPTGGEPNNGYRVLIIDTKTNSTNEIFVPAGTHEAQIVNLGSANYQVTVYADTDGELKPITDTANINIPKTATRTNLVLKRLLFAVAFLIVVAILFLLLRRKRKLNFREL